MSSLQLYSPASPKISQGFAFEKVSRSSENSSNKSSVLEKLNNSGFVNVLETASFDFPNFPEANKSFQVVYFELDPAYSSNLALFKSIISSGKPDGVILEINRELGNFTLKYYAANEEKVKSYLKKIFGMLEDENRFKAILKKFIQIQAQNKKEEQLLQRELFSA